MTVEPGLLLEQHTQAFELASLLTKHVSHVHLAADTGGAAFAPGLAVAQHAHAFNSAPFDTRQVSHVHLEPPQPLRALNRLGGGIVLSGVASTFGVVVLMGEVAWWFTVTVDSTGAGTAFSLVKIVVCFSTGV